MEENNKSALKELWGLRNITVQEFIQCVSKSPDLKFLLTSAGIWYLMRSLFFLLVLVNVIYFVYRVFSVVLS